jgi:hypothetical protein
VKIGDIVYHRQAEDRAEASDENRLDRAPGLQRVSEYLVSGIFGVAS